ncbi:MAG: PG0541 family transporter-associated protein [Thermodesulfobacteriota bacterium]
MQLLQISFRFEYTEAVEEILDRHEIQDFVRYPLIEGKGLDGKHYGTQVFPGNFTVVQAQVPEAKLQPILKDLQEFKQAKSSHQHLQALVLPVLQRLE